MTKEEIDRIECAVRHIKTAIDIDDWAKDIAIVAMQNMIANCNAEKLIDNENLQNDENSIDDETPCVLFCNWNTANEFIENDKNIEDCLVISSYLDDNEAILVTKDEFLDWVRGNNDDTVSIQTYMQCAWERDIAIGQLQELGYGFGEKIRTDGGCISRQTAIDALIKADYEFTGILSEPRARMFEQTINALPLVQPDIVRCKDCKFYALMNRETKSGICGLLLHQNIGDDWYCAGAERRTDDGE